MGTDESCSVERCENQSFCYMRIAEVSHVTGLAESTIWEYARKSSDFPRPYRVGARATAWRSDEIELWMRTRPRVERKQFKVWNNIA